MKRNFGLFFLLVVAFACGGKSPQNGKTETSPTSSKKLITAGGTITEIVDALGHGDEIVATDKTSTYPAKMQALPSIGYRNQIQAEGILSLNPDLILVEEAYLNSDVLTQLKNSGKTVHVLEKPQSIIQAEELIASIGTLFNESEKAQELIKKLGEDLDRLQKLKEENADTPKVAFIMSRGPEMVFLAGKNTFADAFITLSGAEPVSADFEGMKPLTPEALPALNPDYILLFESGFNAAGGKDGLKAIQGITQTEAWKKDQLIAMDGHYISSFGPRLGQAAIELFKKTHP